MVSFLLKLKNDNIFYIQIILLFTYCSTFLVFPVFGLNIAEIPKVYQSSTIVIILNSGLPIL